MLQIVSKTLQLQQRGLNHRLAEQFGMQRSGQGYDFVLINK